MLRRALHLVPGLGLLCLAGPAAAHLELTSQVARYGADQKIGPCGVAGGVRTSNRVYTAKPGSQVMLVWDEFIAHPSHFRIAFDDNGADFTDPLIICTNPPGGEIANGGACWQQNGVAVGMVDGIPDTTPGGGLHNYLYTLPNVACNNCTLQVIQVMYDKPPYTAAGDDIYYQCLDIILDPAATSTLTLIPTPGGPGVEPPNGGGAGGGSTDACSAGGSTQTAWLLFAALFAVAARGRTRRRTLRR